MAAIHLLLKIILQKYIFGTSWNNCILHFTPPAHHQTLIQTFENTTSYHFTNPLLFSQIPERCECIIIWDLQQTDNFTETILKSIDHQLLHANMDFRYNNRRIIVITDRVGDSMDKIFATKSLHFVVNFLLIVLRNNDENCSTINLFTHKYIGTNGNQPILLDTFDVCANAFKNNAILFPDKLTNQNGRPLRIHTTEIMPHSKISSKSGYSLQVAMEYSKLHNNTFLINGMDYSDPSKVPKYLISDDIFKLLPDGGSDLAIRPIYLTAARYEHQDTTSIAIQTEVTALVPKATQIDGSTVFTLEFSTDAWILLIVTLFIQSITLILIKKCYVYFYGIIINVSPRLVYTIALQQPVTVTELPKTIVLKLFLTVMRIQALLVVTMYCSKLASNFTNPNYYGDVKTVADFVESDLEWGGKDIGIIVPLDGATNKESKIAYQKFKQLKWEELLQRVNSGGNFAILTNRYPYHFWGMDSYVDEKTIVRFKCIKDNFFQAFASAFLRRSSVLTESVSKFIMRAFDCGLIGIWDRQAVYSEIGKPVQRYLNSATQDEKQVIKLSLGQLYSIFLVWAFGIVISTIVFLGEMYK